MIVTIVNGSDDMDVLASPKTGIGLNVMSERSRGDGIALQAL